MSLKHFKKEEFDCQATGTNNMEQEFLEKLDKLRGACGFPFEVTSGYRHPTQHPIEMKKAAAIWNTLIPIKSLNGLLNV